VAFHYAGCASQGARSYQEDAAALRTAGGEDIPIAEGHAGCAAEFTLALADGMGGHAGGAPPWPHPRATFRPASTRPSR
jgi:serine/threonine protein phosphatase PrpC